MAYTWTIQKAAVEQQIFFPTECCFEEYTKKLSCKEEPFEIISKEPQADGGLIVVMRKRYNNNVFLRAGE